MAKKKEESPSVELTKEDFIKRLKSEITKEFGQGVFKHGNSILDRQTKIVKWSPSLDNGLSGGVPLGSWMSISGPEKHGKTYVTLCLAAAIQKQYDLPIVYLNVEGRLKRMNLLGVNGLDISEDKFIVIESTVEKTLSTQDYLKIAEKWLRTCPCMIIIDSVSSLADEKELTDGLGTMTRGHNNVVISQFITLVGQLVGPSQSVVVGIIQDYANTSGYGAASKEKAATKWKYQADIAIRMKKFDKWMIGSDENGKIIGQIVHADIRTSALGNPFNEIDVYLRFGYGIDKSFENMKAAESCGLINKAGAWYTLDFLNGVEEFMVNGEPPKKQGSENCALFLRENEKAYDLLCQKLKEMLS